MPLPAEYTHLLNDLNRDVMRAAPSDPLQFCANWFNARLEQQRKAHLGPSGTGDVNMLAPHETAAPISAGPFAPSSSSSSSGPFASANPFGAAPVNAATASNDMDDSADDGAPFAPPPAYNFGRRTSVSAESLAPASSGLETSAGSTIAKTVIPKTDSQMSRIAKATEGNLLFRNLEEDQYRDVLLAMKEVKVDAGTAVIEQGAQGDYFYVVESGTLDVYIDDHAGPRTETHSHLGEKKISYGPSASFGELALLYAQPRAATVLSTSPCILWALDRVTFRSILMETNNRRREMYESFIKEVPLFEHLSASERAKMSDALELRSYEVGKEVVKQGERGTEFFVIVEGEAEVRKRTLEREEEAVGRLGKGDYFGELALLNNAPRAATIVAAPARASSATTAAAAGGAPSSPDRLRVATLSESAFTRLLGPLAGIMGRHARERYGVFPSSSSSTALGISGPGDVAGSLPPSAPAATSFAEIAPHEVGPTAGGAGAGQQPGGGTWIGGLGTSPFGAQARA
ncbi:camp-dependent protein kinase regulatory subunit [Jaminaea rosea]|uniref:cAMP-dependent protein kinase regulatory subunit n=1 Tax=Jaminaea rosea TaxID=1569628 RepID=A0A316UQW9_9BASI|nr:camp-dependent protein kinase regulatory subunit [Jaminaea rosea]PWN27692.1 camp-dependent protein kinase regulatory subunit [Jaminaea rosea]